ncbi:unnamed protein product, partial [Brenthis ino]
MDVLVIVILLTAFLIIALAIVVNERVVTAQNVISLDQMAVETKNKAMTIVEGPKIEKPSQPHQPQKVNQTNSPELRPPSKPPILHTNDKKLYFDIPQHYYNSGKKIVAPPVHLYTKEPLKLSNSVYKYQNMIPMQRGNLYYNKPMRQPPIFAASNGNPSIVASPKFSLPVQTINGIRTDFVKPPKISILTISTTTTTETPTTTRVLRTKRIWPKRILEKMNSTSQNLTITSETKITNVTNTTDLTPSSSRLRLRFATTEKSTLSTTPESTTRGYRRVTRAPKIKSTTTPYDPIRPNDWVPIVPIPSHYVKVRKTRQTPINKRSDIMIQPLGFFPLDQSIRGAPAVGGRKRMIFFRKRKRQMNPYLTQDNDPKLVYSQPQIGYEDLQPEASQSQPKLVTKIKHHHHHHHHRYIKTVEKPVKVPYKVEVEVPKPYPVEKKVPVPVPVEKVKVVDRPYPIPVEKRIPYPVAVKVPQPVPVKVVEKEYVPKPYPIIHHVPIVKHVEIKVPQPHPVEVEKKVPYPVQVPVTVEKRVPVPYQVEKRVPYPVPVRVLVPQPYPVERKVPYPVEVKVKEPVEVIKHVHVRVPYPQPYPVKVPHPVPITVEKKVPYPVQVEKKIPVPVEIIVPRKIEVERRVPVYIPRPYPVEKRVPYPVKVPYPVRVPVKVPVRVPVEVPVYIHHPFQIINDDDVGAAGNQYYADRGRENHYYTVEGNQHSRSGKDQVTSAAPYGFISRSDSESTTAKTKKDNSSQNT